MKKALLAILLVVAAGVAEDKAPEIPKLKDSVRADILDLEKQELALQIQFRSIDDSLKAKLASALKDSGIDESKWRLDPSSLQVAPIDPKEEKK